MEESKERGYKVEEEELIYGGVSKDGYCYWWMFDFIGLLVWEETQKYFFISFYVRQLKVYFMACQFFCIFGFCMYGYGVGFYGILYYSIREVLGWRGGEKYMGQGYGKVEEYLYDFGLKFFVFKFIDNVSI